MKIKTQAIDKIEDVREGDVVILADGYNCIAALAGGDEVVTDECNTFKFKECTVVRITVEEE